MKRPKPFAVGRIRVRAIRGPKQGRWYWRAEDHRDRATLWAGWASRQEVEITVAAIVADPAARLNDRDPDICDVSDLLGAWVWHVRNERPELAERSRIQYELAARRLVAIGGTMRLERFGLRQLEELRAASLSRWSPETTRGDLRRLGQAWSWGRSRGAAPDRELPKIAVAVPKKHKVTPTAEQVARTLEQLNERDSLLVRVLFGTGARVGEIEALTWGAVDFGRGELHLDGKTGPRVIPLRAELVEALRERWSKSQPPPHHRVGLLTSRTAFQRRLDEACRRASVPRWTPHALRRAAVDQLARSGVDVATAAALLGHSVEVMLSHYRQVTPADLRQAIARSRLGAIPAGDVIQLAAHTLGKK